MNKSLIPVTLTEVVKRLKYNQILKCAMTKLAVLLRTSFFLLAAICVTHADARSQNQKVTLQVNSETLQHVFKQIKKQTGLVVFYSDALLNDKEKISINVKEAPLEQVMERIIDQKKLRYEIQEKYIVISAKPEEKKATGSITQGLNPGLPAPPPPTVHGRITNEKGEPVSGVNISIKGGKVVGVTNDNGEFTLTNIPDNATLVFSAVSIETFETKINGRSELALSMKTKVSVLDEVQIIAYGESSKRLSTGNVTTIKSETISNQPVNNVLLAMQGRVPGVYIEQTTGNSGGRVNVRVQGQNSIANGNNPFYVIDGVPYTSALLIGISQTLLEGNPLNFINPSDIESISILKDADATAIYGSRAANGAILITTKKGTIGRTILDVNLKSGSASVVKMIETLNTQQYLEMRKEGKLNSNSPIGATDYDINGTWDQNRYTDWQKQLIGGTAKYNDVSSRLSGGNQYTKFTLGATYHKETTVYPGDLSDKKGSVNFNINHTSENRKLNIKFSGSYLDDVNSLTNLDLASAAYTLPPNAPALYDSVGNINYQPNAAGTSTFTANPLRNLFTSYKNYTNNLISSLNFSYSIIDGLTFSSNFGYNKLQTDEYILTPLTTLPLSFPSRVRSAVYGNRSSESWIIEPQLNYRRKLEKGNIEVLLGTTFQNVNSDLINFSGTGYNSDEELLNKAAAASLIITSRYLSTYKYNALFARINYNYNSKFLVNLTGRRDGSSRFGSESNLHNFYSIGTAWVFTDKPVGNNYNPILNFGKIRLSYGTTGSDQIPDYSYLNLYSQVTAGVPYQGITSILPSSHANPLIQWEETKKLNLGVDLAMFSNKLQFSINYFRNRSSNQLLTYPLPIITGFYSVLRNIPANVQNTGIETSIMADVFKGKKINWSVSFNLTVPNNKLISFPELSSNASYSNLLKVGDPITAVRVFKYSGVNSQTGLYEFYNSAGALTGSPNSITDKIASVNVAPVYYGGLSNTLEYKGFTFDIFIQFVKQTNTNYLSKNPGSLNVNQPILVQYRWRMAGDISETPKALSTGGAVALQNFNNSTGGYSDASFIRAKNITLSYQLPESIIGKKVLQSARIFILGQNLLTISGYKGIDPETRGQGTTLPPLKTIVAGIQITL